VFTAPRHEKRIVTHCEDRQITSFLPVYQVKHRWKNRQTVTLDLPLFPNYLFVHIDPQEQFRVLNVPGVVSILSTGNRPLPVPDQYITALQGALLKHRIEPHSNLEVGDRVCITSGPMAGMEGILERRKNGPWVVLKLEMIGRSVAVEVAAADLEQSEPYQNGLAFSSSLPQATIHSAED
jgi:transcription antitermination factor NusG